MAAPRPKVLIVDDNSEVRNSLARLLRAEGYEAAMASAGAEGFAAVGELHPDLILLDVLMADMDGFEVCRRVKANPDTRLVPVVLLTGLSDTADRIKGIEAGADDFIIKPPDRLELLARVRSLVRIKHYTDELDRAEKVIFALARSIEARDPYTEGHCDRLSHLSSALAERMGLDESDVISLRRGGIVHDLGKIRVPDAILCKGAKLTDAEWEIIRRHPEVGEEICRPINALQPVLPIIRHHHERLDGSGYPDGLAGDDVPLTARVLQIVDVYDALTTDRPYRTALARDEALEIMEREVSRGWWDSDVFNEFAEMVAAGETTA